MYKAIDVPLLVEHSEDEICEKTKSLMSKEYE